VRNDAYRERHSKAGRRRAQAGNGLSRSRRPGRGRQRDKSDSDESSDTLAAARNGIREEFEAIRGDERAILRYIDSKGFVHIKFEKAPANIRSEGVIMPSAHPCPDRSIIDAIRQMDLVRWSSLSDGSKVALAMAGCNPNFLCTVLPSFEGRLRHLEKYDRSDPPPPDHILEFFRDTYAAFPRGEPDVEYFRMIEETSHVEAFRERWAHVLHKSSGIDGEKIFGASATKAQFLDDPGAEHVLGHAMHTAKVGCFTAELMRAAGRAKVMPQDKFIGLIDSWLKARKSWRARQPDEGLADLWDSEEEEEPSDDDPSVARLTTEPGVPVQTMDRLIWISPPSSLHVATPGARTLARSVREAQISTYGQTPFRGGAQRTYRQYGYLGAYKPTHMQVVLSGIAKHERTAYYRALERDRDYHVRYLFGMGSDVQRMDSSMRKWWIQIWGQNAYADFPMDEEERRNWSQALIEAHCGGKLALDGKLVANVEEGATTGAVGVSGLESTYRWISDLLGVTFNLAMEIVRQLRRSYRRGRRVDQRTADLAGRNHGLSWLKSECVGVHPSDRPNQLGEEEVSRRVRRHNACRDASRPRYALYPPVGPGSPLFEALRPIVAFYYNTIANGDDDWNTFPLLEYIRLEDLPSILDPGARMRWLSSPPIIRETPQAIISNERMERAATMLRLPTLLNKEKGVEGRGLKTFMLNSMRPVWSQFDRAYTFYIESSCLARGLEGLTHPDDRIKSPAHTVLRLVGLVFNHPDPRVYQIYRALADELAERHGLRTPAGLLNVTEHLNREKSNTLYNVMGPGSVGFAYATELREGRVRFPEYHEVLEHHGLARSAAHVRAHGIGDVDQLIAMGFPHEDWNVGDAI